jgi:putative membrane protein
MMWWQDGNGWGGWVVMLLSMAIFWGGLFVLIVWAVRQFTPGPGQGRPDPVTILEERFARGEISKEGFEEGRRVLNKGS